MAAVGVITLTTIVLGLIQAMDAVSLPIVAIVLGGTFALDLDTHIISHIAQLHPQNLLRHRPARHLRPHHHHHFIHHPTS